ncbi:Fungal specific transcription factor domain-containing protein [Cladophialophora immunda]|nr:Fungal specific transcription factor domain-containing protein [Cladophialophora immunda]
MNDVRAADGVPSPGGRGRRRAKIACRNCNSRKVVPRKKRGANNAGDNSDLAPARSEMLPHLHPTGAGGSTPQREDEGEVLNRASKGSAFLAPSQGGPWPINRAALSYTGDDGETAGSLGELLKPVDSAQPSIFETYLVPGYAAKKTPPEELEFLRVKGAFSIPPKDVCDKAVIAFFRNAHPLLPVLDAKSFLDQYSRRGCEGVSLILLWSILHVAASFLPMETVRKSGFQTKKAMKLAMYQHVKLLYDNNQETDHFALVQAVIILGYWHPDSQDRFDAWHWTGIAISMAQSMGLHRSAFGERPRGPLPADKIRLARRIWWSCVIRDRWLAFIKGRPMRIDLEDCDTPLPSPSDIAEDLDAVPRLVKEKCIVYSSNVVGELWSGFARLSILLGRILRLHSKNLGRVDVAELEKYEAELQEYAALATIGQSSNPYEQLFACQVRLHHEAITIMLFRPFVLSRPKDPVDAVQSSHRTRAAQKTRAAANNMNAILEQIMNLDLVDAISPAIISPLVLAMQIHLLDCTSSTRSISRLGHHRLQLCMIFQAELKDTYWGADGAFQMFERAQEKLLKTADRAGKQNPSTALPNPESAQPPTTLTPTSNDLSQSEMMPSVDDILAFDFAFTGSQDCFMNGIDYHLTVDCGGVALSEQRAICK